MPGSPVNWHVPWGNECFGEVDPPRGGLSGSRTTSCWSHIVGASPHAQSPDGASLQLSRDARQLHVQHWSEAALCVLPQGRYAALLVSLYGTGLYQRYDAANELPENVKAVQHYLAQERAFQEELLATLRSDPHYGPYATEEVGGCNRRLVGVWDALSLAICFGRKPPLSWQQVPTSMGSTILMLTAYDDDPTKLMITPWPFHRQQVTLVYEGRYLTKTFSDETMMREALRRAP
jgi:hypothetical protein